MDLTQIKTKSGKTIQDFIIPEELMNLDPQMVQLILESESMDDDERQYWFNLTEVMSTEQLEKLRDILVREKERLAEIEAKYAKKKVDPAEAARIAQEKADQRAREQAEIKKRENQVEAAESKKEEELLSELEEL